MSPVRAFVLFCLLVGSFLRFYRLDHYPLPMHQDELSNAYDAYSIVETGADRAGDRFPLVVRGVGAVDYRGALYAWMAAVPVAIGGFSPANARIPSAVLGALSLLLLFMFARTLGGDRFAMLALAFATLGPWHITYSRLAHEGAMLAAFSLILALWLWQRAAIRSYRIRDLLLVGLTLGISTSGYASMRLVAPLIGGLILFDVVRYSARRRSAASALLGGAVIGGIPQLFVLLTAREKFFARFTATVPASETTGFIENLVTSASYILHPRILFSPNMEETGYLAARLLPVEILFYYTGLLTLHRVVKPKLARFRFYPYASFLLASVPALISLQSNSMRFGVVLLLLPLWSAAGALWLAGKLSPKRVSRSVYFGGVTAGVSASFAFTAYMYLASPLANGQRSTNVLVQLGEKLKTRSREFEQVVVVDSPFYAGLHVGAFSGIHPREYQRTGKIEVDADGWDYVREVGKYRFARPDELSGLVKESEASRRRTLYVSRDTPEWAETIDGVSWGNDRYQLWVQARLRD